MTICLLPPSSTCARPISDFDRGHIDQPYDVPDSTAPVEEPDEPSNLEDFDAAPDDECWDVFIPDEGEYELEPDPSDFWGATDDNDSDDN
jgi:hypothetical protein